MERVLSLRGTALAERLSAVRLLDGPAEWLAGSSSRWQSRIADLLRGRPLGHAVHPALTDLPIGFWTSAFVLDLVGGRRSAPAAQRLVALGVASAVPTALAGFADLPTLSTRKQRAAVVHALSNSAALALFASSWWARARGHRGKGIVDGVLGSAVATLGGYLGGWMVFGREPAAHDHPSWATGSTPVSRLAVVE
jgi:uncharacterized membrane protein